MKSVLIFFSILIPFGLLSNSLSLDVSSNKILTKPNQKNINLIVFGYNDDSGYLVLKVIGPQQKVILQNKKKLFGVWTWSKTGEFTYPALYHFYSNKPSEKIEFNILLFFFLKLYCSTSSISNSCEILNKNLSNNKLININQSVINMQIIDAWKN